MIITTLNKFEISNDLKKKFLSIIVRTCVHPNKAIPLENCFESPIKAGNL